MVHGIQTLAVGPHEAIRDHSGAGLKVLDEPAKLAAEVFYFTVVLVAWVMGLVVIALLGPIVLLASALAGLITGRKAPTGWRPAKANFKNAKNSLA